MRKPSLVMLVALAVLFVARGGVGVAATGGNFILGQANMATATTLLSGSTAAPQLKVVNANTSNHTVVAQAGGGSGIALYGQHTTAAGAAPAIRGESASTAASAFSIYGLLTATAPAGNNAALRGQNNSTNGYGYGVWGSHAGKGTGVYGQSPGGPGVLGLSTNWNGVQGIASASAVSGVYGQNLSGGYGTAGRAKGSFAGALGDNLGSGPGVSGSSVSGPGGSFSGTDGLHATASSGDGVVAESSSGFGVYGSSSEAGKAGVEGADQNSGYGVEGIGGIAGVHATGGAYGVDAAGVTTGVRGTSPFGEGVYGFSNNYRGVDGESPNGSGVGLYGAGYMGAYGTGTFAGVQGYSPSGSAVMGTTSIGYAGDFKGKVYISGNLRVDGGCTGCASPALRIDDPIDPAHRYLQHSAVASPDMMDLYNGIATTDAKGFATVRLPSYFQTLNRSFRYQLTVIGKAHWAAKAAVWDEIAHNRFTVRTDQPDVKVSWQVTGIRHDAYANAHPTKVLEEKPAAELGKYLNPELYGKPKSDGIGYRKAPTPPKQASPPRGQ